MGNIRGLKQYMLFLLCIAESGLSETVLKVYEAMNSLLITFFERVSVYHVHVMIGQLFTCDCSSVRMFGDWTMSLKINYSLSEC